MRVDKQIRHFDCNNDSHKRNPLNRIEPKPKTQGQPMPIEEYASLNELRDFIHETAVNKGWWESERELGTILMLCVSELSEALEEYRKGYSADYVYYSEGPKPEGVPVELADAIIRILDYCGYVGIDIQAVLHQKLAYNNTRSYRHGGKVV